MLNGRPGRFLCLTVEDNGTGIDEITLNRIFDPFFTTKAAGKGTGLGLAVVYGIVDQHKGWLNVTSKLGEGTKFSIYFPATSTEAKAKVEDTISYDHVQGKGETIILVEDEEGLRKFLEQALKTNGYNILTASTAMEAKVIFADKKEKIDILFADVVLPDQNGVLLLEDFLIQKPQLKYLLSSGYTDQKSQWDTIQEKGYPFIHKPFNLYILLKTLREILK
ncbi:MAG: ATP-binding protein [Spirochaetota bacterium]|nr:ATP-binding protein [Spirochaetota bacterium]